MAKTAPVPRDPRPGGAAPSALYCRFYRPQSRESATKVQQLCIDSSTAVRIGRGRSGAQRTSVSGNSGSPANRSSRNGDRSNDDVPVEDLLRDRPSDRGRLHEAVAGEAARRVDAVGDAAEDRVRVRRSCRTAPPTRRRSGAPAAAESGARAARAGRRTPTSSTTVSKPHRGSGSCHRQHERIAARGGSGNRSRTRRSSSGMPADDVHRRGGEQLPAERPHRQLDAELRTQAPPTTGRRRSRACPPRRRGSRRRCSLRTSTPSPTARRTSSRVDAARIGDAVLGAERRAEHVVGREPGTKDASTRSTGTPSSACSARRASSAARPVLGRREEQVADLVEERLARARRRTRCCRARARTSGAVENCWRTPPIAREVEPPPIAPRSQSTTSPAPREREPVGDARPHRPRARDQDHGSSSLPSSSSVSGRSGARTSPPIGTPRRAATALAAAWKGKPLERAAQPLRLVGALLRRLAHERGDDLRDTPTRAPRPRPRRLRPGRARPATRRRRRRRARRSGTARPSPTACRRPSARAGSATARAAARPRRSGTAYPLRAANS